MCIFRSPACVNPFPHSVRVYGRSPVWVLMCPFRLPARVNPFPHSVHVYGRSPLCVLMCIFRSPVSVNTFPTHSTHVTVGCNYLFVPKNWEWKSVNPSINPCWDSRWSMLVKQREGTTFITIANPLRAKFFRGNKNIFAFYVIPPHWYGTGSWNPSSSKTRTYLFYVVNIMAADVLATKGARASTTMILTY